MTKTKAFKKDFGYFGGMIGFTCIVIFACIYDLLSLYSTTNLIRFTLFEQLALHLFLWAIIWYALFYSYLGWHLYLETNRLFGSVSSEVRNNMKLLSAISKMKRTIQVGKILLFYTGAIGVGAFLVFDNWRFLFITTLAFGVRFWLQIRVSTPPVVIVLGTSDSRCVQRHWVIKRVASPLRVVSLLDVGFALSKQRTDELHLDCLRTTNDDDWWEVIKILFDLVPLIVVDTHVTTDGVVREGEYIHETDLTYKCFFISEDGKDYPLLEKIIGLKHMAVENKLCIVNERRLIYLIDNLLTHRQIPTRMQPLASILITTQMQEE